MLDQSQAQIRMRQALPGIKLKAWTQYQDYFLFSVEYPSEIEKDYDPFFSVDPVTGEVCDFSILPDLGTILNLKWTNI